jgi:hypothetical protein
MKIALFVVRVGLMGLVLAIMLGGCSVSHKAMRGSVVAIVNGEPFICIGSKDALQVGDTLSVYRTKEVGFSILPLEPYRSPDEIKRSYRYEKTNVGRVRITRIVDEHYAAVEVLAGEIDYPDIVEMP